MRRIYLLLFLLLLFPLWGGERGIKEISLKEAIKIARERNSQILLAKERIEESKGTTLRLRSYLLPRLSLLLQRYRIKSGTLWLGELSEELPFTLPLPETVGPEDFYQEKLRLTIPLLNRKNFLEFSSSRKYEKAIEWEARNTEEEITYQVIETFLEVLKNKEAVEVARGNLKRYELRMNFLRDKMKAGMATQLDLEEGKLKYISAELLLKNTERLLEASLRRLRKILGIPPDTSVEVKGELIFKPLEVSRIDIEGVLKSRADFLAQKEKVRAGEERVRAARAAWLPTLNFYGEIGRRGKEPDWGEQVEEWNVGIVMRIPVWDSGERKGSLRERESEWKQDKERLGQLRRQIIREIKDLRDLLLSSLEEAKYQEDRVEVAERKLELKEDQYKAGTASYDEVFNAEVELFQTKFDHIESIFNYNIALAQWFRALGKIEKAIDWISP